MNPQVISISKLKKVIIINLETKPINVYYAAPYYSKNGKRSRGATGWEKLESNSLTEFCLKGVNIKVNNGILKLFISNPMTADIIKELQFFPLTTGDKNQKQKGFLIHSTGKVPSMEKLAAAMVIFQNFSRKSIQKIPSSLQSLVSVERKLTKVKIMDIEEDQEARPLVTYCVCKECFKE